MKQALFLNRVIWFVIVAVIVYGFAMAVKDAGASPAIRQYPTMGYNVDTVSITCVKRTHFQYHNTDRVYCGQAVSADTGTLDTVADNTVIIIDDGGVTVQNAPANPTSHTDNGNHYGNDKPDNNPNDHSKFNGDNTRREFEQTKGDGKKS